MQGQHIPSRPHPTRNQLPKVWPRTNSSNNSRTSVPRIPVQSSTKKSPCNCFHTTMVPPVNGNIPLLSQGTLPYMCGCGILLSLKLSNCSQTWNQKCANTEEIIVYFRLFKIIFSFNIGIFILLMGKDYRNQY